MKKLLALLLVLISLLALCMVPASAEAIIEEQPGCFAVDYDQMIELMGLEEEEDEEEAAFIPGEDESAEEKVIGPDNRVRVTNTNAKPYKAIAKMRMYFSCCGGWYVGTGFMVSKTKMLTAGHCVYCQKHRHWVDKIEYYFGYNSRTGKSYKTYTGNTWRWVYTAYQNGDSNWDCAVIVFPTSIGSKTGYFKPLWNKTNSYLTKNTFRVAGYPGGVNLSYCKGKVKIVDSQHIKYKMDTEGGQSGGPVYNTSNQAVAIHHSGSSTWNYAHRLTTRVKNLYNTAKYGN